ncbi:hypothetical protein ACC713_37280, partial [Rhizobium johnstonii]
PLWTKFPGAEEIRVLDGMELDEGAPVYAMALAILYPDMDAVNAALLSDVRCIFVGREHVMMNRAGKELQKSTGDLAALRPHVG